MTRKYDAAFYSRLDDHLHAQVLRAGSMTLGAAVKFTRETLPEGKDSTPYGWLQAVAHCVKRSLRLDLLDGEKGKIIRPKIDSAAPAAPDRLAGEILYEVNVALARNNDTLGLFAAVEIVRREMVEAKPFSDLEWFMRVYAAVKGAHDLEIVTHNGAAFVEPIRKPL